MIELMKLNDGFAKYHEDVDMSVPFEIRERYEAAPEKYLPRLLAERAKLYCCKEMGIPDDEVQAKWLRWVVILSVFTLGSFFFFAIATALGVPAMFFSGEKREASVLAVSVLIGAMTLPCLIPAVSLISLIVQRLIGRPQATLADIILWIITATHDVWASLRGRPLPSQQSKPNRFAALFVRNSYFASASTIFLSNLYFVLMGIAIWGVLWLFLFSRNVNYVHESSLSTAEERTTFIESAGKPVTFITGTPAPGPAAMQWAGGTFAFDEATFAYRNDGKTMPWSEAEIETHKNRTIAGFRRDWSRFLLSSVWTWVFLPRAAIALLAGVCVVWFRRDFLPKHDDPDNRKIVDHIRTRRDQVDKVVVDHVEESLPDSSRKQSWTAHSPTIAGSRTPMPPPSTAAEVHNSSAPRVESAAPSGTTRVSKDPALKAAMPESAARLTTVSKSPAPEVASAPQQIDRFAVVGFGIGGHVSNATTRLSNLDNRLQDCGNLNGAKPQLRFRSQWQSNEYTDTSLIVLASLTSVPTVSFSEFLADLVATTKRRTSGGQAAIYVVLTDGKATRERLDGNPDLFETRVSQWMGRTVEAGVDRGHILEFDVSTDAGAMAAWNALKPELLAKESEALQVAGKTKEAVRIVRRNFAEAFTAGNEAADVVWRKHLTQISHELGRLYEDEQRSLLKYLDGKKCSETVKAALDSGRLPSGMLPEEFQTIAKATEFFKTVSPKWIGAGALGGIGLGVASGIAILATGGYAAIPMLMPTLISSTLGGAAVGQIAKTFGFSKSPHHETLETRAATTDALSVVAIQTLQASILQIIVLELQGNTESCITQQVREQTQRLDHHHPENMDDIETMLSEFQVSMLAIGGQS